MTKIEAKKRIEKLRREIRHHSYLYHVLDRQEISDAAWDSLKKELADLERRFPEFITPDSPTQRVSGKPLEKFTKVRHQIQQWSLNDAFQEKEVRDWQERNFKILKKQVPTITIKDLDYICELKIDGLHIVLTYQDGILQTAATRGDGIVGEDVTQNVKTISSIPLRLRRDETCVVEGEVWLAREEFKRLNQEFKKLGKPTFANPRNLAAGSVRQLDHRVTAARRLDSFIYDLVWPAEQIPATQLKELNRLQELGFKVEKHFKYCQNLEEVLGFLRYWEKHHDNMNYLVDGVVIKVNSQEWQKILGYTGKAPRFCLAYKFPPEETTSVIEEIGVQVGRLGRLTPVAHLKPVVVAGTTVSRATLHNQSFIDDLDVRIGDTIVIRKAGDIIPEVVKVFPRLRPSRAKRFKMPKQCPVCGSPVKIEDTGNSVLHFCFDKKCGARNQAQIRHFVSKRAFNIDGLGSKTIARFQSEGLITDAADLFTLNKGDIEALENFGEKSAQNLIDSIKRAKMINLSKFLYALGIAHIGERLAQGLAGFTQSLLEPGGRSVKGLKMVIDSLNQEDLEWIPDFGPKAVQSVKYWFSDQKNQQLLDKLYRAGVKIIYSATSRPQSLATKIFVLTGSLDLLTRDQAKDLILERGGRVSAAVSKKTDYVVAGESPGFKYDQAKELGVKIINEKEFLRLVRK